ncbi:MAG TPA: sugar efflux transporter, partial [Deinococcales bacterium]|nr:sugar efflux transporter [Deinococcales bacterium]
MRSSPLKSFLSVPGFPALVLTVLFLGGGISFVAPFMSLFATAEAGMSRLMLGAFLTSMSISGILINTRLARWSDTLENRKPLALAALVVGATGYALFSVTRDHALLTLIGCVFLGVGGGSFPQIFSLAKEQVSSVNAEAAQKAVTALRSVFSLAWVVGPGIAAFLQARWGFTGLFLGTSGSFLAAALVLATVRPAPRSGRPAAPVPRAPGSIAPPPAPEGPARPLLPLAACFAVYGLAFSVGQILLPLFVTGDLHGTKGEYSLMVSLCALLEIPVMLSFVFLPRRWRLDALIAGAFLLFAAYATLLVTAHSVAPLIAAQALRAVCVAITASLGMAFFQDLLPDRVGTATAAFGNANATGQMLAGITAGTVSQAFGYRPAFALCAA